MPTVTTRPQPAYAHGAIKLVTEGALLDSLEQLHEAVPISAAHRRLFREAGSEFVYARAIKQPVGPDLWLVLLRFGAVVEGRFGFTREVPVLYSAHSDLQIRTTDRLESYLRELPPDRRSISTSEVFVFAPDPRLEEKLGFLSTPSRVFLPLPSSSQMTTQASASLTELVNSLSKRLASRDLYSSRGYVTGEQFFGRTQELQTLRDLVRRRQVAGVFGLRKTGKTSLLHELQRSTDLTFDDQDREMLYVYQDLEHLPALDQDPVPELIQDMAEQIRRKLKARNLRTLEMAELPSDASPSDFRRALDSLLERIEDKATVVLMLDEIEYLCPPNRHEGTDAAPYQRVRQLFGGLRKLTQERDNFSFILAGLASASIEEPELYGAPNPLFSYAEPLYLAPFSRQESAELLNSVGRRVGLHWTDEAVEAAYRLSGGQALLIRELGSCVLADQKHGRANTVHLRPGHVAQAAEDWKRRVAIHLNEVLPHLERYYPYDAELAVILIETPEEFAEYRNSFPDSVHRLERLGIIERNESNEHTPSALLLFSHGFRERTLGRSRRSLPSTFEFSVPDLLLMDEHAHLEFKETVRSTDDEKVPDEVIVDEVVRAILGFLNHSGGTLLVGVDDRKEPIGLSRDIKKTGSWDKLVLFVTTKIDKKIGGVGVDLVSVSDSDLDGRRILRFDVRPAPAPVFPITPVNGRKGLFVRNNASTKLMEDEAAVGYIRRHWG